MSKSALHSIFSKSKNARYAAGAHAISPDRGRVAEIEVDAVVIVGHREPQDALYQSLVGAATDEGSPSIQLLGDALAPGAIVHAVHSGHSFARGLVETDTLYLRDEPVVPTEPGRVFPQR